jgi:hypothetical protein
MTWFKRAPSPEKLAAEAQGRVLDAAREERRSAMQTLLRKLDDIPFEEGIASLGKTLGGDGNG